MILDPEIFDLASFDAIPRANKNFLRVLCVDDSTYNLFVIQELLKEIDTTMIIDTALNGE